MTTAATNTSAAARSRAHRKNCTLSCRSTRPNPMAARPGPMSLPNAAMPCSSPTPSPSPAAASATADVPEAIRDGLTDDDPENPQNIAAYNQWAAMHESILAKSLFSAGTTWTQRLLRRDQHWTCCARPDVDASRVGCGGLSGGGLRTVFLAGLDRAFAAPSAPA